MIKSQFFSEYSIYSKKNSRLLSKRLLTTEETRQLLIVILLHFSTKVKLIFQNFQIIILSCNKRKSEQRAVSHSFNWG